MRITPLRHQSLASIIRNCSTHDSGSNGGAEIKGRESIDDDRAALLIHFTRGIGLEHERALTGGCRELEQQIPDLPRSLIEVGIEQPDGKPCFAMKTEARIEVLLVDCAPARRCGLCGAVDGASSPCVPRSYPVPSCKRLMRSRL
jgi:hypothetical protein